MVGSNEKEQKVANAVRKGRCIIQLGSRGCCKPPADSRQNSGGVQGGKALKNPKITTFYVT